MSITHFANIPIDQVRKYWDSRPCNLRHSSREIGTQAYFEEVEARKYFVEPHIPWFAQFEHWKNKKVLEIGCGIGTDTINFARAGAKVTACDLSEESLARVKQRAEIFGVTDRIQFYHVNAEELSSVIPIEPYDLVYSFGVIHHTPHPHLVIKQILFYMGVNSTLKMMVYHRFSWKVFWILIHYGKGAFWKLEELIARYSEAQTGCPITYTYTKNSVAKLLDEFDIIQCNIEHIFPYVISDYVQYKYKKVWYFRYLPEALFRKMEQRWGWHLCLTAQLKKRND